MIRIAFPTDDAKTISAHFGSSKYFIVLDVAFGKIQCKELRDKIGSQPIKLSDFLKGELGSEKDCGCSEDLRLQGGGKFALLSDCQVLIAGGMGERAYKKTTEMGLKVLLTGEKSIPAAMDAYMSGTLAVDMRRIHAHAHSHE